MEHLGNKALRALTGGLHRVHPKIPVLVRWPGTVRIAKYLSDFVKRPLVWKQASSHRRRLDTTTFIAVVGSAGKTLTKDMTAAVLRSRYQVNARRGTTNFEHSTAENILTTRPADLFCVLELSAGGGPGSLRRSLDLLKPTVGIVTNVGTDHYSAFGSRDAIAQEKGRLVRVLPSDGVAVLNADDPRVIAMRAECRARVITYGVTADADVRAESIDAAWPSKLRFDLVYDGHRVRVQTQMCGVQWVSAALAAACVGLAMGVPLADIARALGGVEPYTARMSPLLLPDGVTVMRDDWKASAHTIPPALAFLGSARAARKIAIIGTISDYAGASRTQYVTTANQALDVADVVIFVGPRASAALRAKPSDEPERLLAFSTAKAASEFFSTYLKPGDLVLLKGSNPADHLYRLFLSRISSVSCWREDCRKTIFCDSCPQVDKGQLKKKSHGGAVEHLNGPIAAEIAADGGFAPAKHIVVGLGNPGRRYANTPHNVGYAVLDRIAAEIDATWADVSRATVASVEWRGLRLSLVKPKVAINLSGGVLHDLIESLGVLPEQVLLVYDDIDLPLGKVRARLRGSDGGHRGVRSILEAFQTDQFRRVKVGVRRPLDEPAHVAVLRPFCSSEKPLISAAVDQACSRLQELIGSDSRDRSTGKKAIASNTGELANRL